MIIGHGDLARVMPDDDARLFFVSGVSNSKETREPEYQREKDLLGQQPTDKQLIYFSTLAILYSETRYTKHKLEMEALVKEFPCYGIMRIGNIDFGDNPHTLINHLRNEKKAGRPLEIQDVYRYIISKEELQYRISILPYKNVEVSWPGRQMKVIEIVKKYVTD